MSRQKSQPDVLTLALTSLGRGLFGIGKLVWRVVVGKKSTKLNQAALFADWQKIENLIEKNDLVNYALAVHQADRFLDHVMKIVGGRGETFADRLRNLESKFDRSNYQGIWDAHKLRNRLAHEHGTGISLSEAKIAIKNFKNAARELGAF